MKTITITRTLHNWTIRLYLYGQLVETVTAATYQRALVIAQEM